MKFRKTAAFLSAAAACAVCSTVASAYLETPEGTNEFLAATADSWKLTISSSYGVDYEAIQSMSVVVEVTDETAYLADKESGFYSDGETAFTDFTGAVSFGGNEWLQFNYETLEAAEPGNELAEIKPLGNGQYMLTAYFADGVNPSPMLNVVSLSEWGNRSPDYKLRICSFTLYGADSAPLISFAADGSETEAPSLPIPEETESEEPSAEETTAEETSVEETAAEETTAVETSAEETTAVETSAEETAAEEASAETTQAPAQTVPSVQSAGDLHTDDSSLMIILIAAGVLIAGSLVGILIAVLRKK